MLGIHVFEKYNEAEWDEIMYASTLLSVLSWKKFHGPMHLYTNEFFLNELKKRGIDKYYDKIDTEFIESRSDSVDIETYWSWNKMRLVSKLEPPFVVVDNDLWLSSPLEFNEEKTFIGYHREYIGLDESIPNYPDFNEFLPSEYVGRWKRWIMPVNTALLYVSKNKEFFKNWINHARMISENSPGIEGLESRSAKTVFIEQRLLPILAEEHSIPYGTFITQIYNSGRGGATDGSEWMPPVWSWDDESKKKFGTIHHIWGFKNYYDIPEIREYVIVSVLSHLNEYPEIENHIEMVNKINGLLETVEQIDHKN